MKIARPAPLVLLLSLGVLAPCAAEPADLHTFTNGEGHSFQARVLSLENDQLKIQRADGVTFTLSVARLSDDDRKYVHEWRRLAGLKPGVGSKDSPGASAHATVTASTLNKALGQPLLADDGGLWQKKPDDVAEQLEWGRESQTRTQSSYRSYPDESYRFAGARPYSAALYGEKDKTASLSLVFANRGDFFGAKAGGEQHFDQDKPPPDALLKLRAAMKADADAITKTLTKALGKPEPQQYGEGQGRRQVRRWDWLGHAFLLSEESEQYVGLAIVTSEFADQRGKTDRVSDASVRERIRADVEHRPNGDEVIDDLPMVDQGPKGYCVPATCERAMRHVGLSADMYLLAVAGGAGLGGGASVERVLETVGSDLRRKGRSFKTFDGPVSFKKLKGFIDDGLPVLWSMDSVDAFNDLADALTEERKSVTDWVAWKAKIAADGAAAKIKRDDKHGHCTMIIGYNEKTREVALSDSWGERYTERWVRVEEAEVVSDGKFYVIGL